MRREGANGKWVRVIDDMAFPAGGPRTMTADLTGKLPPGTMRWNTPVITMWIRSRAEWP